MLLGFVGFGVFFAPDVKFWNTASFLNLSNLRDLLDVTFRFYMDADSTKTDVSRTILA